MGKGISTIDTVLLAGATPNTLERLCHIKSYPDIGGTPDALETSDLMDEWHSYTNGVQSTELLQFAANYVKKEYEHTKSLEGQTLHYKLQMGENGEDGEFIWQGEHKVMANGADVNTAREMTVSCNATTAIQFLVGKSSLVTEGGDAILTSDGKTIEAVSLQKV